MTPRAYSYIRFSKPEQAFGDSLRRQAQLSQEYAEKHNLELDTTLNMRDLGLSGFHGTNLERGALRKFLEHVKQGQIAKGSVLIVENLDRLTRQQVLDALHLFTSIIQSGITIVTLTDEMTYTEESVNANPTQLMMSILILVRAHEESLNKSKRSFAFWKGRLAKIHQQKMTRQCPEWLCLPPPKTEFKIIPDRVEIVQKIFQLKLEGHGSQNITRILNETDKFWNPSGWQKTYIEKILHQPAVYGAYQPYTAQGRKRVPVGEPILGYYPEIVPEATFLRVQEVLRKNWRKAGQVGKVNNLFTHLCKCGYCGSSLQHYGGGKYHYLVCRAAYQRQGCEYLSIPYLEMERIILNYCKGLDPDSVLPSGDEAKIKIHLLREEVEATKIKLAKAELRAANLADDWADTPREDKPMRELLRQRLDVAVREKQELQSQLIQLEQELEKASQTTENIAQHLYSINQLYAHMDGLPPAERINLRLRLRMELKRLIRKITVYAEGESRMTELVKKALLQMCEPDPDSPSHKSFEAELDYKIAHAKDELKIVMEFTSGVVRVIYPFRDTEYDNRIMLEYDQEERQILAEHYGVEF